MKLSQVIAATDREWLTVFEEIGRTDALIIERLPIDGFQILVNAKVASTLGSYSRQILKTDMGYVRRIEQYMMAQVIGKGPKVFRPTEVQALMSMKMKLNIEFSGYEQPFPATVVELPESFKEGRKLSDGCRPEIVVLCHDKVQRMIFCSVICDKEVSHKLWWLPKNHDQFLEDFLEPDESEPKDYFDCLRAAMSYCLLLNEYGVKRVGPDDKERYERLMKKRKKPTTRHREAARIGLAAIPIVYEIDQTPVLYKAERIAATDHSDPTGRTMPPHVRRGHYRMQAHGVGRNLRKRIRIPATFINDHLFAGSMKDLRTTYSEA